MSKHLSRLRNLEGAVTAAEGEDVLKNCLRTPSPSVNWALAQPGGGLPYGTGLMLYGPPKGGKSVFLNGVVGQIHADRPDETVIKFDTELRAKFQNNTNNLRKFGIDEKRYIVYDVNEPKFIFDRIEKDIGAACQEGEKISTIIIDSMSGIQGRRFINADTVDTQQIGDQAATIKDGLMRILPTIRKYNIALICTAHVRAELDQHEQRKGNTIKMQAAWATKHVFEYFCYIEPNTTVKSGRASIAGEEFTDAGIVDFMDKAQKTGHKIRFTVKDSSFPYSGRTAEFTLDFERGIINQYEELFTLGKNYNLVEKVNNTTYKIGDQKFNGIVACLSGLRDSAELQGYLLTRIQEIDRNMLMGVK
jgi:RecA/RadA recombinase